MKNPLGRNMGIGSFNPISHKTGGKMTEVLGKKEGLTKTLGKKGTIRKFIGGGK